MISLHQSREIPWNILVEYSSLPKKQKERVRNMNWSRGMEAANPDSPETIENARKSREMTRRSASEKALKLDSRLEFFGESLGKAVMGFAATESGKWDRKEADALEKLWPDDVKDPDNVFRSGFQEPAAWTRWLSKHVNEYGSLGSDGGELADMVKEMFNREMMLQLLHLARKVPGISALSWTTYSNFFHYGFRRVLEDAMTCYLFFNFLIASDQLRTWPNLQGMLHSLTMSQDWDASLTVYRRLIGKVSRDGPPPDIPEKNIKELQRFSFRMMYQYQVFWQEVCDASGGKVKPIDWRIDARECAEAFL